MFNLNQAINDTLTGYDSEFSGAKQQKQLKQNCILPLWKRQVPKFKHISLFVTNKEGKIPPPLVVNF
jgi:hypothetical protein